MQKKEAIVPGVNIIHKLSFFSYYYQKAFYCGMSKMFPFIICKFSTLLVTQPVSEHWDRWEKFTCYFFCLAPLFSKWVLTCAALELNLTWCHKISQRHKAKCCAKCCVFLCNCFPNFTLGFTSSFFFCGVSDSKGASMGSDALLGFTRHTLTPLSVSRSQSARQLDCINCTGKNKPCKLKTLPYECLFFYYTATLSFWLASEKQSTTPDGLVSSF